MTGRVFSDSSGKAKVTAFTVVKGICEAKGRPCKGIECVGRYHETVFRSIETETSMLPKTPRTIELEIDSV